MPLFNHEVFTEKDYTFLLNYVIDMLQLLDADNLSVISDDRITITKEELLALKNKLI